MDPNANLAEQRRIVARILHPGLGDLGPSQDDWERLAELVEDLD